MLTGQVFTEREAAGSPRLGIRVPALVGRDQELTCLAEALAAPPAIVLIEGEAGIGKSRLVSEFLESPALTGHNTLVATCPPFREPLTLSPLVDAAHRLAVGGIASLRLSGLAGALRPLFPEWAGQLPPAPEPLEDTTAARHRLFRALAELLDLLKVSVLVIEDAHWADDATIEFLLFLTTRQPQRMSLIVTYRPEDVPGTALLRRLSSRQMASFPRHRLTLNPLDAAGTGRLVSSMLNDEPVSLAFATLLHQGTEGLPLAVEESVRLLRDRGDLHRQGGEWVRRHLGDLDVPPTVRDAVLEHAGHLDGGAQAVLRAAAVLAEAASEQLLGAVAGVAPARVREGLAGAINSGLVAEDRRGLVSFRHALAARAVHESIPVREKRELHARAGQALEDASPGAAARLIRHFREAGDTAQWSRYAEQAADVALAAGDAAMAAALLHDLMTRADVTPAAVARLARKIPLRGFSEYAAVRDIIRSLRAACDEVSLTPDQRAEIGAKLGSALVNTWDPAAGSAELERALPGLERSPVEAAHAMSLLGVPEHNVWPAAVNRRWLDRAVITARNAEISARDRLQLDMIRASALLSMGEEDGWAAAAGLPAAAAHPEDAYNIATAHLNIGDGAVRWGRYQVARRRLATGLELTTNGDFPRLRDCIFVTMAHLDWFTGSWDGLAGRALALTEYDQPVVRLEASLVCGLLEAAAGRIRPAVGWLRQAHDGIQQLGLVNAASEAAGVLARLRLAEGSADDALLLTEEPVRVVIRKGIWLWAAEIAPVRVQALGVRGRHEDAAELVAAFTDGLRGRTAPVSQAALALCRAIVAQNRAEHDRAAALFGRAAEAWLVLPRPYDALLAREQRGLCLAAAGQVEAGLAELHGVFRELADLGADGDAERVVRVLRGHGVHVPRLWRHGRHGYGDQLSPRENEVVRLVADGHTNEEIARELCRSVSTVRTQLRSAMRKLGTSSRTALAAHVAVGGLRSRGA